MTCTSPRRVAACDCPDWCRRHTCSACEGVGFGVGPGALRFAAGWAMGWCPRCRGSGREPAWPEALAALGEESGG